MNSNQKIAEIIKQHDLLTDSDKVTLKLALDELEQIVPSCNYCDECGNDWSKEAVFNLELPESERDRVKVLLKKLRDMVEGAPDKSTVFGQRWEQERQ